MFEHGVPVCALTSYFRIAVGTSIGLHALGLCGYRSAKCTSKSIKMHFLGQSGSATPRKLLNSRGQRCDTFSSLVLAVRGRWDELRCSRGTFQLTSLVKSALRAFQNAPSPGHDFGWHHEYRQSASGQAADANFV